MIEMKVVGIVLDVVICNLIVLLRDSIEWCVLFIYIG